MLQAHRNAGRWVGSLAAVMALAAAVGLALGQSDRAPAPTGAGKVSDVPEVAAMLANLAVDPPRAHKNMLVFPIRFKGRQAPGDWSVLDDAMASGQLKISELDRAAVTEVRMENTGNLSLLIVSGEIIKGGQQTRTVRQDTVVEPKGKVSVPVFCVERGRWSGRKEFSSGGCQAPASIQNDLKRGASQGDVWERAEKINGSVIGIGGAAPATGSLEEGLNSENAKKGFEEVHKDLGRFSPPETIGIAVADARTGRVVGLELFGRRDLFERLQDKLVEGYATDLVLAADKWDEKQARKVAEADVEQFIRAALGGTCKYEDTPGSGRGIDLVAGSMRGKGVALGECVLHLSIQDVTPAPTPVRPIVNGSRPDPTTNDRR